jgi:hypothetical protein
LPNPENLPAEVVFQKQHHSMPHVRPQSRYPRASPEMRLKLKKPSDFQWISLERKILSFSADSKRRMKILIIVFQK